MRPHPATIALAATALLVAFGGCTTHVAIPPVYLSVAITPRPSSIAQGTSVILTETTTNAPEFSIENTASAVLRLTLADNIVYNRISDFPIDLSATSALGIMASATGNATTDSTNLVNALSNIFMHGQMPAQMQTDIVNHVATLTNIPERVRVATYLVLTSSFYKVEH